ncbi:MAG: poly-beta-1,6-N-acetyl-D-glucosamine N-deacetylase PgaB, partial [Acetobacteraceae bacterium]|nr:poly-beta-1,6-N-acetyl-D-glucosamine N-deacetylase PgaB [Acetobacteraceae bacterium]
MRRALLLLLVLLLPVTLPARAQRFVSIAFHDIADTREGLTTDAVTTGTLVAFLDWLKGSGWTPVSLDDLEAARTGRRALPERAILLTFDDGYRSAYTRLFPLLLAYRFPVVIALVGSWMEGGPQAMVRYGDVDVPRTRFLSWAEAREMQASGLVEFASHSFALHQAVRGNPQGNMLPSAAAWAYDPATGRYEDDTALRRRVRTDLERSRALMRRELGRAPRALVWPFGRYAGPALEAAREAGFRFALTLDPEPAEVARPMAIPRYFPAQAPDLGDLARNLRFREESPPARRLVCLDPAAVAAAGDAGAQDAALGALIEALRTLGANTVLLAAHAPGPPGVLGPAWYPTPLRPLAGDLLGRLTWQIRTRGGAEVFLRLPLAEAAATVGAARVPTLAGDMLRHALADGLALEGAGDLAMATPDPPGEATTWATRARRAALVPARLDEGGRLALATIRAGEALRPGLRLLVTSAA